MKYCNQCGTYHEDNADLCSVCRAGILAPASAENEQRSVLGRVFLEFFLILLAGALGLGTALLLEVLSLSIVAADAIPLSLAWLGIFELSRYVDRARRERFVAHNLQEVADAKLAESPIVSALKESAASLTMIAKDENYVAPRPIYNDDSYDPVRISANAEDDPIPSDADPLAEEDLPEEPDAIEESLLTDVAEDEVVTEAPTDEGAEGNEDVEAIEDAVEDAEDVEAIESAIEDAEDTVVILPPAICDDSLTLPDAFEILYAQMSYLSRRTVRSLLAAMATSRLVLISENPKVDFVTLDEATAALTGTHQAALALTVTEDGEPCKSLATLVEATRGGANPGFVLARIPSEETPTLGNCLAPILPLLSKRAEEDPATFCLISSLPAEVGIDALPDALTLAGAAVVTVMPKKRSSKKIEFSDYTGRYLSALRLSSLAEGAEEDHFLPEELWKKLDALEEHLAPISGFAITNTVALMIERYVAVFLATGGSESEALDSVISARLLPPVLEALRADSDIHKNETFTHYLDSLLGLDNLPMTAELLRKFGIS